MDSFVFPEPPYCHQSCFKELKSYFSSKIPHNIRVGLVAVTKSLASAQSRDFTFLPSGLHFYPTSCGVIWNQRRKIRRILPSKYENKDIYFSHWRVIYCRLITYWPARSMLTHFEEIGDAHRPSSDLVLARIG